MGSLAVRPGRQVLSSLDSLIPCSTGVKKQAGQGGNTAHTAPNVLYVSKTLFRNPPGLCSFFEAIQFLTK